MTNSGIFRKRPILVKAFRLSEEWSAEVETWPVWAKEAWQRGELLAGSEMTTELNVLTIEGIMRAKPGDWIICGISGEIYPCRSDIFNLTYEFEI